MAIKGAVHRRDVSGIYFNPLNIVPAVQLLQSGKQRGY